MMKTVVIEFHNVQNLIQYIVNIHMYIFNYNDIHEFGMSTFYQLK